MKRKFKVCTNINKINSHLKSLNIKTPRHIVLTIQVREWDKHNNVLSRLILCCVFDFLRLASFSGLSIALMALRYSLAFICFTMYSPFTTTDPWSIYFFIQHVLTMCKPVRPSIRFATMFQAGCHQWSRNGLPFRTT